MGRYVGRPAVGNKKVRNATKVEKYGLKFDSKLELFMYERLKDNGFDFEFQKVFELQEGFRYGKEWVRPITWKADFVLEGCVIDTKGLRQETFNIKLKLWKYIHKQLGYEIYLPSSQKACLEVIQKIKSSSNEKLGQISQL